MVLMCKMIISLGVFFHFFKILIFWIVRGVKGKKIAWNDKELCLSHLICQEPYIVWSSFVVHKCKGQKMAQNDKKKLYHSVSQELYLIWLRFLVHICKMMISPAIFFSFFQNSHFLGFSKVINKCQKEILRCAPPSWNVCDFYVYIYTYSKRW